MDLKNRYELAASFTGVGVEVGVEAGKFSSVILTRGKVAHLYSIDPYLPFPGYFTPEQAEDFFRQATNLLSAFFPRNTLLRQDGREAAPRFPDESLDFVYIDSSHELQETLQEMKLWWPKLKSGGILSGHDYANGKDIQLAVSYFTSNRSLSFTTTEADTDLPFPYLINSWIIRKP